jgi:hypothetical protein
MGKSKKSQKVEKVKSLAKKNKSKKLKKQLKVEKVVPAEAEILHEPCGEGQATDVQHLVKKVEKKVEKKELPKKKTYADGLQVNWNVHVGDTVYPYHSVRAMSVGLRGLGFPIGNTEKIRAFIRRRRLGTQGKPKSFAMFNGIDHIYRIDLK